MVLNKPCIIHLSHGTSFCSAAPRQSIAAVASVNGQVTLLQPADGKGNVRLSKLGFGELRGISVHPTKPLVAATEETGTLLVRDLDGSDRFILDPPKLHARGSEHPGFHNCLFDVGGEYLWCVNRVNEDQFEVQLRRATDASIVSNVTVQDPFPGGSWAVLFPAGRSETAALWLSTGQTDTQVYWLAYSDADGLRCDDQPNLEWSFHPVFSPDGQEFLVPTGLDGLSRYRWSKNRWGQNLRCPGQPNDGFSYFLTYLNNTYALVGTHYGRAYLVQSKTMRIVDEVIIEGHELTVWDGPQVSRKEKSFNTDLSGFWRIGDTIAFAFPAPRQGKHQDGDDLLLFDIDAILARI